MPFLPKNPERFGKTEIAIHFSAHKSAAAAARGFKIDQENSAFGARISTPPLSSCGCFGGSQFRSAIFERNGLGRIGGANRLESSAGAPDENLGDSSLGARSFQREFGFWKVGRENLPRNAAFFRKAFCPAGESGWKDLAPTRKTPGKTYTFALSLAHDFVVPIFSSSKLPPRKTSPAAAVTAWHNRPSLKEFTFTRLIQIQPTPAP